MYILQDYHIIWMIVCIFLYLLCIFIIFSRPTKHELQLMVVLASTNIFFAYLTALGFFQIGILGIDITTGAGIVSGYEDMAQVYMVFFGLALINMGFIVYGILQIVKKNFEELIKSNRKSKWREGF